MNNSRNSERMLDKYYFLADRIYFLNKIISNSKMKDLCYRYWYNYINDFYNIYNLNFKSIYLKRMKKSLIKVIRVFIKTHFFTLKDTISILIFLMSADVYKFLFIKREK